MEQKVFVVTGTFRQKNGEKKFSKEVMAHNESFAREKIMSGFGSRHKLKRNAIIIGSVQVRIPSTDNVLPSNRGLKAAASVGLVKSG